MVLWDCGNVSQVVVFDIPLIEVKGTLRIIPWVKIVDLPTILSHRFPAA
jgi:hypothetical protein